MDNNDVVMLTHQITKAIALKCEEKATRIGRHCGDCKLCCKLLAVKDIDKPADTWCPDCDLSKGCRKQHDKPRLCKEFYCRWLIDARLSDELKPNKCGVIFSGVVATHNPNEIVSYIWVDKGKPQAWKSPKIQDFIQKTARDLALKHPTGFQRVECGSKRAVITTENTVEFDRRDNGTVFIKPLGKGRNIAKLFKSENEAKEFATAFDTAQKTIITYAKNCLDSQFGEGYAEAHPEELKTYLSVFLKTAAETYPKGEKIK